jgi:hypothetical protein
MPLHLSCDWPSCGKEIKPGEKYGQVLFTDRQELVLCWQHYDLVVFIIRRIMEDPEVKGAYEKIWEDFKRNVVASFTQ